jgi:hypothetical protein
MPDDNLVEGCIAENGVRWHTICARELAPERLETLQQLSVWALSAMQEDRRLVAPCCHGVGAAVAGLGSMAAAMAKWWHRHPYREPFPSRICLCTLARDSLRQRTVVTYPVAGASVRPGVAGVILQLSDASTAGYRRHEPARPP